MMLSVLPVLAFAGHGFCQGSYSNSSSSNGVSVSWVGNAPATHKGITFGVPWPRGQYPSGQTSFELIDSHGESVEASSWVTGQWPDDSVKWTAHAVASSDSSSDGYIVQASESGDTSSSSAGGITVDESDSGIQVDTGALSVVFQRSGNALIESISTASGKVVGQNGHLILQSQSGVPDDGIDAASIEHYSFQSTIDNVTVSEEGGVRALITAHGMHASEESSHQPWMPFVVRFYLYSNSDSIRMVHSLVYDGNYTTDFISGIGVRFDVPLSDEELYDRHVRLAGVDGGYLNEAVKGITGLRRDPNENVRRAQIAGEKTPDLDTWDPRVSEGLNYIPNWGDYRLDQLSPDGFNLKKRTKAGYGWIKIPGSTRSEGLAYLGGPTVGGLAVGLKDFWQQYPVSMEISNAATDVGSVTMWLYSPAASPMDIRPFHDGLGQDTFEEQLDALDVTYEDYEPGYDTPYGISVTKELYLFGFDATPSTEELGSCANLMNEPPILSASPEYMADTRALGDYWQPPANTNGTAAAQTVESHFDFLTDFYEVEIEQRRWYGFWDYGDIMHTYDPDRHQWRYDIGGYAWDNSELSPNIFFWTQYLRKPSAALYRFAAQHARQTGETDVYHIGPFKAFGTRHGVQHWSDSSKQIRVSQPQYRKYFYYLSGGDERTGELLTETLEAERTFLEVDPRRKIRAENSTYVPSESGVELDVGLDFGGLAAAWLIEWERRGDRWEEARDKIMSTMEGIAALRNGFVTGTALYSIENGTIMPPEEDPNNEGVVFVSHLAAVFGLPEVIDELAIHMGDDFPEDFERTWLDYCIYYTGSEEEQEARYGEAFEDISLLQGHSRLAAWAANRLGNETLAARAWDLFFDSDGLAPDLPWALDVVGGDGDAVNGSRVLAPPVREAGWLATNDAALYGIAGIQNLALVPEAIEGAS